MAEALYQMWTTKAAPNNGEGGFGTLEALRLVSASQTLDILKKLGRQHESNEGRIHRVWRHRPGPSSCRTRLERTACGRCRRL
jgi:hypothetical protein